MKHAPRGWNSWDCYGAAVTEEIIRKNAAYMAEHLKDAGYEYIVCDIQWYEPKADSHAYHPFTEICLDEYGRAVPAENRFPSAAGGKGFGPLAEYVHSLGLKFGIHIMRGIPRQAVHQNLPVFGTSYTAREIAKTDSICVWNSDMYGVNTEHPGGRAYYDSIFRLYASWGVDFIKCDDICRELPKERQEMIDLSAALHRAGREMVLSLSPGPALLSEAELYKEIANMWRITDDFWDDWRLLYAMFEREEKWSIHAGAEHFPDADMLPVGALRQCENPEDQTRFTPEEERTMMTLWCIARSPLFIGSELTKLPEKTLSLLTNPELMDMHEKSRHAHQVLRRRIGENEWIVWEAHRAGGGTYLAVFNADGPAHDFSIPLSELELPEKCDGKDIFTGEKVAFREPLSVHVPEHGAVCWLIEEE